MEDTFDPKVAPEYRSEWMGVLFAAELLGKHWSTLYRRIDKGQLESAQLMGMIVVKRDQILNYTPGKNGRPRKDS
jgi:hypothetical protein